MTGSAEIHTFVGANSSRAGQSCLALLPKYKQYMLTAVISESPLRPLWQSLHDCEPAPCAHGLLLCPQTWRAVRRQRLWFHRRSYLRQRHIAYEGHCQHQQKVLHSIHLEFIQFDLTTPHLCHNHLAPNAEKAPACALFDDTNAPISEQPNNTA
jgi:hypothetical protein